MNYFKLQTNIPKVNLLVHFIETLRFYLIHIFYSPTLRIDAIYKAPIKNLPQG